jgi:hypothetical protein
MVEVNVAEVGRTREPRGRRIVSLSVEGSVSLLVLFTGWLSKSARLTKSQLIDPLEATVMLEIFSLFSAPFLNQGKTKLLISNHDCIKSEVMTATIVINAMGIGIRSSGDKSTRYFSKITLDNQHKRRSSCVV